ncbi:MAG: GGDEF domain-containing protein [Vicinamibacteria bacterium]
MKLRHIMGAAFALLAEVVAAENGVRDPRPSERGFPLMRLFDDTDHHGAPQNFGVAVDQRGYVYVGNLQGVLIFDGAHWRKAESQVPVFAVATNSMGRVLAGGPQTLMVLEPGNQGGPSLRSLMNQLPPNDRDFGDVKTILPTQRGFVILTDARVLSYQGGRVRKLAEIARDQPASIFSVRDATYLSSEGSVQRLDEAGPTPAAEFLPIAGHRIDAVIEDGPDAYFAVLRDLGLVRVKDGVRTLLAGLTTDWAVRSVTSGGMRLRDGRMAFGSRLGGVLLTSPAGDAEQVIDSTRRLPDDQVMQLAEDRDGGLWVSLNGGLARLDVASPITVFDARSGVQGGSQGVFRFNGRLFVFGSTGLGVLENGALRKIPGVAGSTWFGLAIRDQPDEFLLAAAAGLFRVAHDRATLIPGTADLGAYVLAPAPTPLDGTLVGARGGLHILIKSGASYKLTGPFAGSPRYVRSIVPRPSGRVFISTTFDGIVAADFDSAHPTTARFQKLGGVEGDVHDSPDGLLAITNDEKTEVFRIDEDTPRLIRDESLTRAMAGLTAWTMASDAQGDLWINTSTLRIFRRMGGALNVTPVIIHSFPARRVQVIQPEADGVVWVCGESGLFRHVGPPGGGLPAPPAPAISSVTIDDRLVFDGWDEHARPPVELPQKLRRVHTEFGPLSHQRGLAYQFRLDPLDGDWSDWSPRTDVEFTTLQEAAYTFRVRTRGADGQISPESAWTFVVKPPWYRTLSARLGSVLGLLALLGVVVTIRTRVLRHEAELLSQRVDEKTRDLQTAVTDLQEARQRVEEQNRLLEAANARLEDVSRHDSLTGIANRRQFDSVLAEEWLRARRQKTPIAIGILDLDFFKDLNDAHGHPEGDEALRQVARALQGAMRRPADLVARYGGEEFAFILSDTDLAGALNVAEDVRARIEALKLRNPGGAEGYLTASVGLVAAVPADGLSTERLIEGADRALYAAKAGGRNRVRAAEASGD